MSKLHFSRDGKVQKGCFNNMGLFKKLFGDYSSRELKAIYPIADKIEALAIVSSPSERECYPCGACRQALLDAEKRQQNPIRIIMASDSTATVVESAEVLLPFTFKL